MSKIEVTTKEISQEIERRRRKMEGSIASFCPLSQIERCGYETYAASRCRHCHTAKTFFMAFPEKESLYREDIADKAKELRCEIRDNININLNSDILSSIITNYLQAIINAIFQADQTEEARHISDLSEQELKKVSVLTELIEDLKNTREPYYSELINATETLISEVEKLTEEEH